MNEQRQLDALRGIEKNLSDLNFQKMLERGRSYPQNYYPPPTPTTLCGLNSYPTGDIVNGVHMCNCDEGYEWVQPNSTNVNCKIQEVERSNPSIKNNLSPLPPSIDPISPPSSSIDTIAPDNSNVYCPSNAILNNNNQCQCETRYRVSSRDKLSCISIGKRSGFVINSNKLCKKLYGRSARTKHGYKNNCYCDDVLCSISTIAEEGIRTRTEKIKYFPDTEQNSRVAIAAAKLKDKDIIGGFPDGTFKGEQFVNRAELAKFLLLAKKISVGNLGNHNRFPDVQDGEWYVKYVIKAANLGIINGYPDGEFRPAKTVNTAEFLKMLTKTFRLSEGIQYDYKDVHDDNWFSAYAGVAQKYNLFPDRDPNYLEPAGELTRNEVAVAIYQYLSSR